MKKLLTALCLVAVIGTTATAAGSGNKNGKRLVAKNGFICGTAYIYAQPRSEETACVITSKITSFMVSKKSITIQTTGGSEKFHVSDPKAAGQLLIKTIRNEMGVKKASSSGLSSSYDKKVTDHE